MKEINVADMLKEALTEADDHMKVAREKLFQAQNILEMLRAGAEGQFLVTTITKEATVPMAEQTQAFGLTAFWTGIVLIVTSLAIAGFLRRRFISEYLRKMENCFRSVYAKLGEILLVYRHQKINEKTLRNEPQQPQISPKPQRIKASIAGFLRTSFISEYLHKIGTCFRSAHAKLGEILLMYWHHNINGETPRDEPQQPEPQPIEPRQLEPQPIEPQQLEPQQPEPQPIEPQQPEPKEINKEYVKNLIKDAIQNFRSTKEDLKLMKSQKTDAMDVKEINAAIKMVRSIEENLKEMKSQNINEEQVKEMERAIQPAIKAVESMEKIVNKGVLIFA